jgi:hypothetical protein
LNFHGRAILKINSSSIHLILMFIR